MKRWLSHKLHMWATRLHNDFHVIELTTQDGDRVTFACYWQWTGSWSNDWQETCSCDEPDL